jgi:hypothetical protein
MEIDIGLETRNKNVLFGDTETPLTLFVAVSAI